MTDTEFAGEGLIDSHPRRSSFVQKPQHNKLP